MAHSKPTSPILIHFTPQEKQTLIALQQALASPADKKPSKTKIVRALVRVLDRNAQFTDVVKIALQIIQ